MPNPLHYRGLEEKSMADRHVARAQALATLAIHTVGPDPTTGAMAPPVHQTTTYAQPGIGEDLGHTYSRVSNPTVAALEQTLAALEGLPHAAAFATGMAATTCLALSVLRSGDEVLCGHVVYGGTTRLLAQVLSNFDVVTRFVDTADPEAVVEALTDRTRLVIAETPANPTLQLTDLAKLAEVLSHHPALLAVDNTFLTAALQRPADLGADIVIYSTTKFIEGHNTTVGGALLVKDDALAERIHFIRKATGGIQSPWDAWLTLKGIKTLPLRLEQHSRSALALARWLEHHDTVSSVHYPGLDSFPQRQLAERQQRSGGGVLSFELEGGREAAVRFCDGFGLCTLAENLGATETLITHPVTMTHADVPADALRRAGIGEGLIRVSVGLEDLGDIQADLSLALDRASARAVVS